MTIYLVYKTTNLTNGKYYIGKHKCQSVNDSYLGSGTLLKKAINKYGRKNFHKEILKTFPTEQESFEYEATLVTESEMDNPQCYNMRTGGEGGFSRKLPPGAHDGENNPMWGRSHSEETKQLLREKATGKTHSAETRKKLGDASRGHIKSDAERAKRKASLTKYHNNRTPEHKASLKAMLTERNKRPKKWYNNGVEERLIVDNLHEVPAGWVKGRAPK